MRGCHSAIVAYAMAVLAGLGVAGCERQPTSGPVRAVVTIAPLASVVRPLLPSDAELTVLMAPGRSEHGYEFTAEDVAALGRADLVVFVGLGLEAQVESFLRKHPSRTRREVCFARVVGFAGGANDGEADAESEAEGERGLPPTPALGEGGHNDEHDHAGPDPHLWLDPVLVRELASAVAEEVIGKLDRRGEATPMAREGVAQRLTGLLGRIDAVDAEYRAGLAPFAGRAIVTHHAAFGRLAERYGLRVAEVIRPVEGGEPTPQRLAGVVEAIRREGVGVIFVEPQFDATVAERIAQAAGVKVGRLDPLGDGDWFALMRANLGELVRRLSP